MIYLNVTPLDPVSHPIRVGPVNQTNSVNDKMSISNVNFEPIVLKFTRQIKDLFHGLCKVGKWMGEG